MATKNTSPSITILTPTYNRSHYLLKLYQSLKQQTSLDFLWLIIDDGSSDSTKEIIKQIQQNSTFDIQYIFQENGGKHLAINSAMGHIQSELVFIVDSDDLLVEDAITTILSDWSSYKDESIIGFSYLRGDLSGNIIGDSFYKDFEKTSHEKCRFIEKVKGDKAEVWKTSALQSTPFPEYPNERFISEQFVYLTLSGPGFIIVRNKILYITEYLPHGLTSNQRCLQYNNPLGTLANSKLASKKAFGFKQRLKSYLLIVAFSIKTKNNLIQNLTASNYGFRWWILIPLGFLTLVYFIVNCRLKRLIRN
jgi:glycosyltransferase involved in cell wall biosynthesis